ncbi:MAG: nitroreductase family protein [Candidatus Aminicenantia bacterium]
MDVKKVIEKRRAYRSLEPVEIDDVLIKDLAECACLAPSCFNYQPWRFVFVYDENLLKELRTTLTKGNEWVYNASMIIAVFSEKEMDCIIKEREYYLFDVGLACAFMILRATELGLVAHPIAGFHPEAVKQILEIPEDMNLITLIILGKHSETISPYLSEKQILAEKERPPRKQLNEFVFINKFKK